jgi:hypothetical protein
MHKIMETSQKLIDEALRGLERGYNEEDLRVLGEAIDIIKDVKTIEAMDGNYELEINDEKAKLTKNIPDTEIDDNIILMEKHFKQYCNHKKEYQRTHSDNDKMSMMKELEHFLYCMMKILEEMKSSSDFTEERDMVKTKLREMFALYQ